MVDVKQTMLLIVDHNIALNPQFPFPGVLLLYCQTQQIRSTFADCASSVLTKCGHAKEKKRATYSRAKDEKERSHGQAGLIYGAIVAKVCHPDFCTFSANCLGCKIGSANFFAFRMFAFVLLIANLF